MASWIYEELVRQIGRALFLILVGAAMLWLLAELAGCNANSGEQALARIENTVDTTLRDAVHGEFDAFTIKLDDHSARITETTQKAVVAVSKVDNSTSDRVVNRVLVIGTVMALLMLVASYPIGKVLWMIGGKVSQAKKTGDRSREAGK
jgi:hypothetical protein